MQYPGQSDSIAYPLMYAHNPDRHGKASEHVLSVPPDCPVNLKGLSELIEQMEDIARARAGLKARPVDKPRPGYEFNDPWYDEREKYTILDNPNGGTLLDHRDLLEALWFWGNPLANMMPALASTSVFVPAWIEHADRFLDGWQVEVPSPNLGRLFLPYVHNLFSSGHGLLSTRKYTDPFSATLDAVFETDEGSAVDLLRGKMKTRLGRILGKSRHSLLAHRFEYGLVVFELLIEYPADEGVSLFDTQWMEHFATLTPASRLFGAAVANFLNDTHLLFPTRHFTLTSVTGIEYRGGFLTDGRSTGGALQMVVDDAEPLYRNLPNDRRLITDHTVVDGCSKRQYHSSPSSMLSICESHDTSEHQRSTEAARLLYIMVLSQRFVLAKSRNDIILSQKAMAKRREISFSSWATSWFRQVDEDGLDIAELREGMLTLSTRSWFNVVSGNLVLQRVFENLRSLMRINELYSEVQDRGRDLDDHLEKKESSTQSTVFTIFTFILSPLTFVAGITGGLQFSNFENPFPFVGSGDANGWKIFSIYCSLSSMLFGGVWVYYRWKARKG